MTDLPLIVPAVACYDSATGALRYVGPHGTQAGGMGWSPLPTGYDEGTFTWSTSARMMVEDAAKVEAQLIAAVKAEAERRKMAMLSPGGAKKAEYADKGREVAGWDTLGGTASAILIAFNLLPAATKAARFPYATASAARFGDTVADAIGRFKGGIGRSASVPALAAIEEKACAAIKAAGTAAAKRAAHAAIVWSE